MRAVPLAQAYYSVLNLHRSLEAEYPVQMYGVVKYLQGARELGIMKE